MNQFTKQNLKSVQADLAAAFTAIAEKHGISIKFGRGTFNDKTATLKLELGVKAVDGTAATKESTAFTAYAELFGFKPEQLGAKTRIEGITYTIVGLRPNAPKRPILIEGNGKRLVASPELVQRGLL